MTQPAPLFPSFGVVVRANGVAGEEIDHIAPGLARDLIARHGAVLWRDFVVDEPRFDRFLAHLTDDPDHFAPTHDVREGDGPIWLHAELYFVPRRPPDLACFACLSHEGFGGETTLCDGVALAGALDPEARRVLETERLRLTYTIDPDEWRRDFKLPTVDALEAQLIAGGVTVRRRTGGLEISFAFHALRDTRYCARRAFVNSVLIRFEHPGFALLTFEDGRPIERGLVDRLVDTAERHTHLVAWQAGDVLVVDNTRLLHGRRGFRGARTMRSRNLVANF